MRSFANFKGHPIHPMLIPFPIALLTAALVSDAVGQWRGSSAWWTTGAYLSLAGIASGLVAAVPGVLDYLFTVPPGSSAKKRATYHMLVNVTSLALFGVAWLVRGAAEAEPGWGGVAIELAGMGLLSLGGWMGGTLAYRNFIGTEHRYPETARWSEVRVSAAPGEAVEVAAADELKVDQMRLVRVGGKRIVLARTHEGYIAFDDHCTHRGGSLCDGVMIDGKVQCLWHGSRFDAHTGQVERGPAKHPLKTYTLEQRNGKVLLRL